MEKLIQLKEKFTAVRLPQMIKIPKIRLKKPRNLKGKFILFLFTIIFLSFIFLSLWYRNVLISKIDPSSNFGSDFLTNSSPSPGTQEASSSATLPSEAPSPPDNSVLGTSTDNSDYTQPTVNALPPTTPSPLPSYTPLPDSTNVTTNSTPDCSSNPNADNSQVYINGSSQAVTVTAGSSATITVDLEGCNNNKVSNDNLSITLASGDPDTSINGKAIGSGYNVQAQGGEYTFQVSSANPTTVTLNIQDTFSNFSVTMPGYKQPEITFSSSTSSSSSPTNSGCTTGSGVPNSWYSDVYPPSGSVNTGTSATFSVTIRDCNKNGISSPQNLTISLSSGDSSTKINNNSSPITITTDSSGNVSFNVTSQNATTDSFSVEDTTASFSVTTTSNGAPTVTFVSSNSSPTPTPSPSLTPAPTPPQSTSPSPSATASPSP